MEHLSRLDGRRAGAALLLTGVLLAVVGWLLPTFYTCGFVCGLEYRQLDILRGSWGRWPHGVAVVAVAKPVLAVALGLLTLLLLIATGASLAGRAPRRLLTFRFGAGLAGLAVVVALEVAELYELRSDQCCDVPTFAGVGPGAVLTPLGYLIVAIGAWLQQAISNRGG